MYLNNKATLIGGLAMVLLAITTIVLVALSASSQGSHDPSDQSEVAAFLTDQADNQGALIASGAVGVLSDAVLALVVASMLFVLFRDRSAVLAPIMLVAIVAASTVSALNDILGIMTTVVAKDFVEGGPGGIAAGDPAVLELGRFLGMLNFAAFTVMFAGYGLALLSLGLVLARAPLGAVNPPRWLGWVAIVSAAASWLSPLVFVADPLFLFFPIQLITTLILFFGLGGWLIAHSRLAAEHHGRGACRRLAVMRLAAGSIPAASLPRHRGLAPPPPASRQPEGTRSRSC